MGQCWVAGSRHPLQISVNWGQDRTIEAPSLDRICSVGHGTQPALHPLELLVELFPRKDQRGGAAVGAIMRAYEKRAIPPVWGALNNATFVPNRIAIDHVLFRLFQASLHSDVAVPFSRHLLKSKMAIESDRRYVLRVYVKHYEIRSVENCTADKVRQYLVRKRNISTEIIGR